MAIKLIVDAPWRCRACNNILAKPMDRVVGTIQIKCKCNTVSTIHVTPGGDVLLVGMFKDGSPVTEPELPPPVVARMPEPFGTIIDPRAILDEQDKEERKRGRKPRKA